MLSPVGNLSRLGIASYRLGCISFVMPNLNILSVAGLHSLCYFALILLLQASSSSQLKAIKHADVVLGGLFPVHNSVDDGSCNVLFKEGVVLAEAMIYAVEFVNENKMLPHEITFGYDIRDTCNSVITALETSLDFVSERNIKNGRRSSNFSSPLRRSSVSTKNPVAVIGAGKSVISSAVNNILSIFGVPQIGYASTSRILSNKNRYPTFVRTVPPDSHQGRAIAKIVSHFRWNYVALLASDDIYGRPLAETFKIEAKKFGICLALDIRIPYNPTVSTLRKTVGKLRTDDKNIEVILLFTSEKDAFAILDEAAKQNVTEKLWIASDSWADSPKIAEDHAIVVAGMFGIINQPTVVPDFMKHFYALKLLNISRSSWLGEFWEEIFHCTLPSTSGTFSTKENPPKRTNCSGRERLSDQLSQTDAVFSRVSFVLDAVLSVVHSIRKICPTEYDTVTTTTSEEKSREEDCLSRITPSSVLSHIFNVTFNSLTNRTISFDSNGDGTGRYDIINLQRHSEGRVGTSLLKIGEYDGETDSLKLLSHAIHWPSGVTSPPNGRCSLECPPGTYKIVIKPICCWLCKPCPSGSVSNVSGVSSCIQCPSGKVANDNKTDCVVVSMTFLRWKTTWAWVLVATTVLCETICFVTVIIFFRYRETPIVKAANREISFLLLFALLVGFLIPLAYIGRPTGRSCKLQVILFGASFSFSLSIILARINRTIVVFRYSKVSSRTKSKLFQKYLSLFLYNRTQIMLALFLTVIELLLCVAWLLTSPPRVTVRRLTMTKSLLMCETMTSIGHIISNAFIIFLSLLCTFVAFKSRKLPQNYNEAKFISFAMFVFNFIGLTFVGAIYGTPDGQHNVIINCFAILASNFAILALIFVPKIYIILLRPELNQMAVFRALTAQYTFKTNQRRSTITSDMMGSSCVMKENRYVQTSRAMIDEEPEALKNTLNGLGTVVSGVQRNKTTAAGKQQGSKDVDKGADKSLLLKHKSYGSPYSKAVSDSALNSLFQYPRDSSEIPMHWIYAGGRPRRGSVIEEGTRSTIGYKSVEHEIDSSCQRVDLNGHVKCLQTTELNRIQRRVYSSRTNIKEFQSRVTCRITDCECKGVLESYV